MNPSRTMTRELWYWYYRRFRICRREALKASMDMLIYGNGVVHVAGDGIPTHVPYRDFVESSPE